VLGRNLEEAHGRSNRAARLVHVELGLQEPESKVSVSNLRQLTGEFAPERPAVTMCELVDDHPADVVAVLRVLAARVAETDDKQVERRGRVPALEETH
jgi:hypothetical protein